MNTQKLLKELGIVENKHTRKHASGLKNIHSFLKENKKLITGVNIESASVQFGRETEKKNGETTTINEGQTLEGYKIIATTQTGCYSFVLPKNVALYNWFGEVIDLPALEAPSEEKQGESFTISADILAAIKKAVAFVDKDKNSFRPALQCICIDIKDNVCKVIATNAIYVYISAEFTCNYPGEVQLLIKGTDLKGLQTSKAEVIDITIYRDSVKINGNRFDLQNLQFVDYNRVLPDYKNSMNFDRPKLLTAIKTVEPFANPVSKKIDLHLNGNISLYAQDVDMCWDNSTAVGYNFKEFPDVDISFNSSYLRTCLNAFKSDNIDLYSAGEADKIICLTDGKDKAYLMPVMKY